ncbi:citrate lyase subunit beta/citryl-CoA lyase [Herbaspirillum sp. Sphag1AN]|uniref:HpcH/HpaI aldolase/citrate lyase family protein n=1 Tax=unclassified Herbaspirillum TaxID=2624150 RepID=UPI00161100D8|nr:MULTISPECIES: aldolase/citrate lyase family protein [unclassified Herbaspirillum]MBB3210934.1 citrate lyase subunit beta/citryl-CoA lyase [Herbaspirillum sp. Sphag1AN]MBB3244564.1 citrate lyase subunit beta/citryl-CoA lyase [Herbaspirillum sp. Sphag64]
MHPTQVLFPGTREPVSLPVCDHYAGSEKLMRKSIALQQELGPIFDITLDCEDGASAGNEVAHAQLVASLIASDDNRFARIGARIHDLSNAHFASDIEIICQPATATRLAYLMLPKVNSLADVQRAIKIVSSHTRERGVRMPPLHVLIETHGALAEVHQIAALPEIESLSFGVMDFVSAHHGAIPGSAMRSPGQFSHPLVARAKLEISAACHAHGKVPSHNVTTEIQDTTVVTADAQRAAMEFGYTRMWSIHPLQIQAIVHSMRPADDEVALAAQILLKAQQAQWGPIQHEGRLHDRASYRYFWSILQRAHAGGVQLPSLTESWFKPSGTFSTTSKY